MFARSTRTFAGLALVSSLAVACGASPGDEAGSSQEAMNTGGGGGGGGGGDTGPKVRCGSYGTFGSSSFEQALAELGCTAPRAAFAVNSWQAEYVTNCPTANMSWLQALVDTNHDAYPYYSTFTASPNSTCSSWRLPQPAGYVEVSYDPNCSGANCGSLNPD
jgi:hypothetical protein